MNKNSGLIGIYISYAFILLAIWVDADWIKAIVTLFLIWVGYSLYKENQNGTA